MTEKLPAALSVGSGSTRVEGEARKILQLSAEWKTKAQAVSRISQHLSSRTDLRPFCNNEEKDVDAIKQEV